MDPKHIGLALSLHQKTRSRKYVNLFNRAGHCLSYNQVLQIDTSLAQQTLQTLDKVTGAVTPPNLLAVLPPEHSQVSKRSPILQVTADNIDILTDTPNGKNTFHGTQMVAFQHGCASTENVLESIVVGQETTLDVPDIVSEIFQVQTSCKIEPIFSQPVTSSMYEQSDKIEESVKSEQALDYAFFLNRQNKEERLGWTEFNSNLTSKNPETTAVGYMPTDIEPSS